MKNIFFALLALFSTTAYASSYNYYTGPYAPLVLDFSQNGIPGTGLCIGGSICGVNDTLKVIYQSPTYVSVMHVNAHDNVGNKYKAHLQLFADGQLIGDQDVLKAGSSLTFSVARYVRVLELRSVHELYTSNGDETIIMNLQTY